MRITFVHSPEDFYDQNYGTRFTPLWAYYLAAYVPENWDPTVVDCRNDSIDDVEAADVFAFSGINQDLNAINRSWGVLKNRYPNAHFIVGGPITWSFDQEGKLDLLDHFDHIFILDGEDALPRYLQAVESEQHVQHVQRVVRSERVPFQNARVPRLELLDGQEKPYYGAVIEVSRGCPFLCEFCDIRVLPDNNQTHTKPVERIIEELEAYHARGITQFQFATDNFIGRLTWAHECVDAILEWRQRSGAQVSIFTWLTINLYRDRELMKKMRRAGFDVLFIGIESVNRNSLLECAKVQNMKVLDTAVSTIHSHGFIIAPGFIFGFDSDDESVFEDTIEFMADSGTIGGDPSFLMALAGTPLYERMKSSGRLVERASAIVRQKITTNIRYLQNPGSLAAGFVRFVKNYTSARFQERRFERHLEILEGAGNHVQNNARGYASPLPYLKRQLSVPAYRHMLLARIVFVLSPRRTWTILRSWLRMRRVAKKLGPIDHHFFFWLYTWTNLALKYKGLTESDLHLHGVPQDFDRKQVMPEVDTRAEAQAERHTGVKASAQGRYTRRALQQVASQQ